MIYAYIEMDIKLWKIAQVLNFWPQLKLLYIKTQI